MLRTIVLNLCLLLLTVFSVTAQEMPGESFTISSEFMKGDRKIQVALPKGYNTWTKYDVHYMLDPVWNMSLRKSLLDFTQQQGIAPRVILVGIVSPDRTSDMTPTNLKNLPTSGNADNFIKFIDKEVKPFIEEKYKTTGNNTFAGHSFGGLCVMYAFLKYTDAFDSYLVGDPSFWYDDELLVELAKKKLPTIGGKVLFIGGRKGYAYKGMGIAPMEEVLKAHATKKLDWKITAYEDETHNSVIYKLNYDGVKFIAEDFRNKKLRFVPEQGEIISGIPLDIFTFNPNEKLRYTIDGTEPNFDSELFGESITISKPSIVKVKVPSKREKTLPAVSGEFVEGKKMKGIKKSKKYIAGLNYKYYEGDFEKLPNFDTISVVKKGVVKDGFQLKTFPKKEKFACVFEGFIEAKESGYHYFSLKSDDGLKFYIHDKLMIVNDWRHTAYTQKSTVIYLKKGMHPIKYEYFQHEGKSEIQLLCKFPNEEPGRMDFNKFYIKK